MRADDPALPGEREAPTLVGGAYIQFVRFQGTELADTIRNQQEIRGPLPDLIHRIDQLLEANIEVATSITERSVEIRRPDYPLMALQQLVRNAVLHRSYEGTNAPVRCYWYDDRIEISSPGGPYGQVTAENFGQPAAADYRNRYLAEAMRVLEFVQRFGPEVELAGLAEGVDFAEAGEAAGLVGGEGGCLEQPQDDLEPCLDQVVGGRQLELYRQLPGGARRPFEARYDGTDRWLKRLIITRDLRKSRRRRPTGTSRLLV